MDIITSGYKSTLSSMSAYCALKRKAAPAAKRYRFCLDAQFGAPMSACGFEGQTGLLLGKQSFDKAAGSHGTVIGEHPCGCAKLG